MGGFVRQYQVTVDPNRLAAYGLPLMSLVEAIRSSNNEVGGRLIEWSGAEYMVRARGYIRSVSDLEEVVVKTDERGTPVRLRDVASIQLGPEIRRGIAELDGEGEVAAGVVVMRHGANAMQVIRRVKERIRAIEPTLPDGVRIVTTYDRSELIERSIRTLEKELVLEMLIVSLVILIFLWHIPSAIIPIVTIPVAVFLAFIPLYFLGLTSNIMSLAGIAISIGVLVDGAIVEVENAYKRLEQWVAGGRRGDFHAVRLQALKEVGPSVFFSLLVIAVAFMMVFSGPISNFVDAHPTVKVLALSFLLLIGVVLVADGFGQHISKGYIYFAMGFAVFVEAINLRVRRRQPVRLHEPYTKD